MNQTTSDMLRNLFLALLLTGAFATTLSAQTTDDQARDDLDYYSDDRPAEQLNDDFTSRIWWGTGAQLQFQGGNNSSIFQIGLSPIAGYKINNFLSFGPRASILYNAYRFDNFNGTRDKFNFVTWSGGLFTRAKIFGQFFAHAEYSLVNEVIGFSTNDEAIRTTRAIPFLGGGLSQGGGPGAAGFEFMVLFRLTQADQIGDAPFEIRSGLNFNF